MWALANIAGDSAQTRDLLIANDIIPVFFTCYHYHYDFIYFFWEIGALQSM